MPGWLGFSFAPTLQRPATSAAASSSKAAASASSSSSSRSSSSSTPTVRALRPEELSSLQSENAQLRKLLQQLSEQAQQKQQQQHVDAATAGVYPSLAASLAAGHAAPPASNPHAGSGSGGAVAFKHVTFDSLKAPSSSSSSSSPSAPAAPAGETSPLRRQLSAASLSEAELAPVNDFYESLRASLATKPASSASTVTATSGPAAAQTAGDVDDEWDDAAPSTRSAPPVDSVHAPRTEDEAVVHNKYSSVVVHKKPLARQSDDDDEPAGVSAGAAIAAAAPKDDLIDDDFTEFAAPTATAAAPTKRTPGEENEEEVAIFDLRDADWWYVVPHPDREGEELKSAPAPPLDPQEDEDGFVVVKNKDSFAALGDFIAQMMLKHPEINRLTPEQLKSMLEGSIGELKTPGTFGKLWQYGKSAYTLYGWTSTAWSLYQDQTMLRIAAAGVIKCATWTCIFLL